MANVNFAKAQRGYSSLEYPSIAWLFIQTLSQSPKVVRCLALLLLIRLVGWIEPPTVLYIHIRIPATPSIVEFSNMLSDRHQVSRAFLRWSFCHCGKLRGSPKFGNTPSIDSFLPNSKLQEPSGGYNKKTTNRASDDAGDCTSTNSYPVFHLVIPRDFHSE